MLHGTEPTPRGLAALRDLAEDDIEEIVHYWHFSGDAHLQFLGIDPVRMGSPDDTRARYLRAVRTGDADQRSIAFAITLDGAFIGYTLLNQYEPETNFSHWHIVRADTRAAGVSTALYPHRIKTYFDTTRMARLIHQTRTRNVGVNRMLDKFVPIAETGYVEHPDGIAGPGEFHTRHVRREDVPHMFARAAALAGPT